MTVDKRTLDKAKKWAEPIDPRMVTDGVSAAAEVILNLPTVIVDGDKLREISNALLSEAVEVNRTDPARASTLTYAANSIDTLLPAPAPQVEIRLGAWAMHPEHGKVLIAATRADSDGRVRVNIEDDDFPGGATWAWAKATDLSPLPDTQGDSDSDRGSNCQGTLNSSPEPQPGEAWLVDCLADGTTEALYTGGSEFPWVFVDPDEPNERRWIYKSAVPLRRLVPAQEPRVLTTEADYENAAQNTVVRRSDDAPAIEKVDIGTWWSTEGHSYHDDDMAGTSRTVLWEPK